MWGLNSVTDACVGPRGAAAAPHPPRAMPLQASPRGSVCGGAGNRGKGTLAAGDAGTRWRSLRAGVPHVGGTPQWAINVFRGKTEETPGHFPPRTERRAPVCSALDTLVSSLAERHTDVVCPRERTMGNTFILDPVSTSA